ncbi:LLM class flavin-dependent oxidoreductase [Parasedimentitalea maritima]|uniref:LLM class flavin-dependent oxidoreductase n=1 Tax=Parasedimentitalea maritima TaxID=2578117 RepID=A0ABY2UXH7_9RHOB|nr:MupA/Atu3671 family FMN-dependent luciferase-like monooxygenase [Zongyanglinia marina]TLP67332.1 LLM class flavin-dependent oxidoreductase [Zongyanglinia marina]
MSHFSCVVIGNESLLIGCADALLRGGHDVHAVVSTDPDICAWATDKGLTQYAKAADLSGNFDWLFSIANLTLIPDAVLNMASKGAINFHDGPLPRYAGLNTPNWALINGEAEHGITWHMIEGGVDEGDIVAQRLFPLSEDETAFSLNSKCYAAAIDSFGEVMAQLESGAITRTPQDLSQRSYFSRADRPAAGGRLDFTRPANELSQLVRALDYGGYWNPLCAAKVDVNGRIVLVGSATVSEGSGPAGTVLDHHADQLTIATGDGAITLGKLTRPNGAVVDLNTLCQPGDILTSLSQEHADALTTQMAATQAGETHWRNRLKRMQPVTVPLARKTGESGFETIEIALPQERTPEQIQAAVLGWALLSTGDDQADLALSSAKLGDAAVPDMISDWVPIQARRDEPLPDLLNRLENEQKKIIKFGGFAADLAARDPDLSAQGMPGLGLMLDLDAPIQGCAATLAVTNGTANLHFDRAHLGSAEAALLAARLHEALNAISTHGEQPLSMLSVLPEDERRKLLTDWNATARDYPTDQTIHAAFEAQAARSPNATALVYEDQTLSYAALNAQANRVATKLQAMGVKPGSHVGLYVSRSPDLVIAALAVMKAGGAYVPLDPAYPADRIAHYLQDSQAQVVVTQTALQDSLPSSDAQVLVLDAMTPTDVIQPNVDGGATAEDLAYLIYTSGSTGTPKGVMLRHANVANFFAGMDDRIPFQVGDTWLALTSLSFDISVLELFWTLSRGFKLVLSSDESRLNLSNGPIAMSNRKMDFNLFYWGNDDGPGPRKYQLLLDGARFADANGFNAVWTPERHFHAFGGPYPNPSVTGAAVAAVTSNISVRAGSCVAPLHHPARAAEEWSVIDNLTNGRAGLGIASGWQPDDFILRPENTPPANKPAMYETIEVLRKLWRGEEVEFPRKDGGKHAVITQPRPVSKELPIWVTTAGNPDTWREAGEIGANVLTHLLGQSIDEVGGKIRIYHDALRKAGHNPDDFTVTLMLHTYLDDTREQAREIAREPMKDYLRSAAGLIKQYAWAFPAFKRPKGVENAFDMKLDGLSAEELEAILEFAFERYFEDSGLFGTVQDAVARVEQLKRIGVDEIACLIDYGIAPDVVMEGLKPLAETLRLSNAPTELAADDFSLAAQVIRHDVSHMQCTPSMARMICMNGEARLALGQLQQLMIGGEALPGDLVEDLRQTTQAQIHNMYGPTETTIWSTVQTLEEIPSGIAPIGTPIANTSTYVLDDKRCPVPIGAVGELFIGGAGVAAGYWQRADLTSEMFVDDPFNDGNGRMYRTGDLVRWRSDGQLGYLGRTDTQVKIRGQRIELGEIEAAIAEFDGITAAVVVARTVNGNETLVGYITTTEPVDDLALCGSLALRLAEVMVPAHIVTLDQFPLTPNKKIDRKALPDPKPTREAVAIDAPPPAAGAQAQIAAIWGRILGVGNIRAQDSFFALGGHSLLAVQAHRDIRAETGVAKLSITDIFRFPTLSGLAAHLDKLSGGTASVEEKPDAEAEAAAEAEKSDKMSKRRAMRANRKARTG